MEIDYIQIDPKCRALVKFFNEHGLETVMSCQGHDNVNQLPLKFVSCRANFG